MYVLHVLVFLVMPEAWMAPLNTYNLLWYQEHDWYLEHLFACSICEWLYALLELEQSHLQRKFSNIVWSSYRIFTCTIVCCVVTQNLWLYLKCIQNTTRHKTSSQYKVCFFQSNMFTMTANYKCSFEWTEDKVLTTQRFELKHWTTIVCYILMSVCLWYKFDVERGSIRNCDDTC